MENEIKVIRTEKELGQALKSGQDEIVIEGDLVNKSIKLRATGKIAWVVAIGAIGLAVGISVSSAGLATPVGGVVASAGAVSVLGISTTSAAISIAVAAGGVGALNSLRKYKEVSREGNRLVLRKR